ncbi:MAG: LysR family transcriptional regulator [Bradyrhizobium sp.]|nr:LysR family transcriptional regulator [Bradyrhizobium sp.]
MDLVSLRYFVETARLRSISRAAASLGVVQPALTRRIQLLEERLGVPLLLRHRRGVEPTEAGLLVLERAELILRMTQQLENEIRFLGVEPAGPVALGFPPSMGILIVGKLLSQCSARYPRIKLMLQEDYSPAVRASLLAGRLDIGIMSCEAQHPDLICQPLFSESMWLIGRQSDWRFPQGQVHSRALDKLPLLIGSFMRTLLEKHLAKSGVELTVVAEADSLSLAREAVRAGAGFFVGPLSALDRELKAKEFVGAPLNGLEVTRGLFRHRGRSLARAAITLSQMIETEIALLTATQPETFRTISGSPLKS